MTAALPNALFPGGYLVAESGREPAAPDDELRALLAGWSEARIGPYVVRCDASWRVTRGVAGDAEVLLWGTAMDVERPLATQAEAVQAVAAALARSDAAFLDALDTLNGAHVMIARRGERCWAVQDATGMEALCYDLRGDLLAASHPALIAALRGYELSPLGRLWIWGNPDPRAKELRMFGGRYWFPGVTTAYESVRALTPNTRLDLATRTVARFWPRGLVGVRRPADIVDAVAPRLQGTAAWVAREYGGATQVSLSGGIDTRLTLAATREVRDAFGYFTYEFPKHHVHQNDIKVATQLAERFGLDHRTWPLYAGPALKPSQPAWRRTHGGLNGLGRIEFAWAEHYPTGQLHVRSNVLEVMRGFYLKGPPNRPDRFDAGKLARVFKGGGHPEFTPHFEEFMAVTDFSAESKQDVHFSDLFYWEQRLGRWHAELVRRSKLSHATFILWNNRRVLELMMARPLDDRRRALIVYALIDRLWPEVLEVPVFSGAHYVDRPDGARKTRARDVKDWGRWWAGRLAGRHG